MRGAHDVLGTDAQLDVRQRRQRVSRLDRLDGRQRERRRHEQLADEPAAGAAADAVSVELRAAAAFSRTTAREARSARESGGRQGAVRQQRAHRNELRAAAAAAELADELHAAARAAWRQQVEQPHQRLKQLARRRLPVHDRCDASDQRERALPAGVRAATGRPSAAAVCRAEHISLTPATATSNRHAADQHERRVQQRRLGVRDATSTSLSAAWRVRRSASCAPAGARRCGARVYRSGRLSPAPAAILFSL